jgi:hypothetical protein
MAISKKAHRPRKTAVSSNRATFRIIVKKLRNSLKIRQLALIKLSGVNALMKMRKKSKIESYL